MNIEPIKSLNFELIKMLQDYLLIFDDCREEIYEKKDFVKIGFSGRHRGFQSVFVKHKLLNQSR